MLASVNGFVMSVCLAMFSGFIVSFIIEYCLEPKIESVWRRPIRTVFIHFSLWLFFYVLIFLIVRRPWFAMIIELAVLLLIVQVSNAKYHSLREPFIFQDIEYFTDAIKYPRLYLPFLGVGRALIIGLGFGLALYIGLTLESAVTDQLAWFQVVITAMSVGLVSVFILWLSSKQSLLLTFNPATDLNRIGLLACLWRYYQEENHIPLIISDLMKDSNKTPALEALPHVVVVQSESFFDVRRLFMGIKPEVLQEFDALKQAAMHYGQLQVSAWGANTVRTEFAFLSGLPVSALGVHQFNPYRKLAQQGIPSIASVLKKLGYRTVCIHPYHASFYNRDQVMPKLGFDEFIDIKAFKGIENTGPYIGDVEVAKKVSALLDDGSTQPLFVFVNTMENHGPLHLEKVGKGEVGQFYATPPPENCEDLTLYLRHLHHADLMVGMLRKKLQSLSRPSGLCWYGDHVPIMPTVYQQLGEPEGQTDYVIWKSHYRSDSSLSHQDLKVESLSGLLLKAMGLL